MTDLDQLYARKKKSYSIMCIFLIKYLASVSTEIL